MRTTAVSLALFVAALSNATAHNAAEEHTAKALRGVQLGQLGPADISCVTAAHGSRAAVDAISVYNDVNTEIKLVAVQNDGTKTTCGSPYTGVGVIGPAQNFRLMVDEMVDYVMVLGKVNGEVNTWKDVHEIWRSLDGTKKVWPKTTQIWSGVQMDDVSLGQILEKSLV